MRQDPAELLPVLYEAPTDPEHQRLQHPSKEKHCVISIFDRCEIFPDLREAAAAFRFIPKNAILWHWAPWLLDEVGFLQ